MNNFLLSIGYIYCRSRYSFAFLKLYSNLTVTYLME